MKRDPDRMSSAVRSMITEDHLLNDLTFRLVEKGPGGGRKVGNASLFVPVVDLPRRRERTARENHPTTTGTVLARKTKNMGK